MGTVGTFIEATVIFVSIQFMSFVPLIILHVWGPSVKASRWPSCEQEKDHAKAKKAGLTAAGLVVLNEQ